MAGLDIVLLHGAWTGPWLWRRLTPHLEASGHRVHSVSVPGIGETLDGVIRLETLTEVVEAELAEVDSPLLVVGHGEGGIIATEFAEKHPERIAGVVFIGGIMLPHGYSFAEIRTDLRLFGSDDLWAHLQLLERGRLSVLPAHAAAKFLFHRASEKDRHTASHLLRPQREDVRSIASSWTAYRFGRLPRLFIETLDDRAIPLSAQRRMQQLLPGSEVVSLHSDHCPMISMSEQLAAALSAFAAQITEALVQ